MPDTSLARSAPIPLSELEDHGAFQRRHIGPDDAEQAAMLASLGFAMIVFVHLGGSGGLVFVLPLLMFVFSMALGEDYNILVMIRIREEAAVRP